MVLLSVFLEAVVVFVVPAVDLEGAFLVVAALLAGAFLLAGEVDLEAEVEVVFEAVPFDCFSVALLAVVVFFTVVLAPVVFLAGVVFAVVEVFFSAFSGLSGSGWEAGFDFLLCSDLRFSSSSLYKLSFGSSVFFVSSDMLTFAVSVSEDFLMLKSPSRIVSSSFLVSSELLPVSSIFSSTFSSAT